LYAARARGTRPDLHPGQPQIQQQLRDTLPPPARLLCSGLKPHHHLFHLANRRHRGDLLRGRLTQLDKLVEQVVVSGCGGTAAVELFPEGGDPDLLGDEVLVVDQVLRSRRWRSGVASPVSSASPCAL